MLRTIFIYSDFKEENGASDGTRTRDLRRDRPGDHAMVTMNRSDISGLNCHFVSIGLR